MITIIMKMSKSHLFQEKYTIGIIDFIKKNIDAMDNNELANHISENYGFVTNAGNISNLLTRKNLKRKKRKHKINLPTLTAKKYREEVLKRHPNYLTKKQKKDRRRFEQENLQRDNKYMARAIEKTEDKIQQNEKCTYCQTTLGENDEEDICKSCLENILNETEKIIDG